MFKSALAKHCRDIFPPCYIIMLSGISSLPGEKHRWHIGIDVFRSKWSMNIVAPCKTTFPQKNKRGKNHIFFVKALQSLLSFFGSERLNDSLSALAKGLISEVCPVRSLVPAWFLILIVKLICCCIL